MSKISEVEKELSKWRKSKKGCRGGNPTPEHIRKQAIELLTDYSPCEIQKRLGININMLKNWQENVSPEAIFIRLQAEPEKQEIITRPSESLFSEIPKITPLKGSLIPGKEITSSNLSLKISHGNWSVEGVLSLQEWQNAINLLEGVR